MSAISIPQTWRQYKTAYRLVGNVCTACEAKHLPPRPLCTRCKSRKLAACNFNGTGKVLTYTVVRGNETEQDKEGRLAVPTPYVLAIIELDEGPRVTAQVVDAAPEDMAMGKRVRLVFRKLAEGGEGGVIRYGFKFCLAE